MKIAMSASEPVLHSVRTDQHRRLAWRRWGAPDRPRTVLDFLLPDPADVAAAAA
jgi:hypothetical protein